MKIKIIVPIIVDAFNTQVAEEAKQFTAPDTQVVVENIKKGAASIESAYDDVLNSPEIVHRVIAAEQEGFDAVFVDCFGDPGVDAAREMVKIPVVGGFQPAVLTACLLSQCFSIITVLPSVIPMIRSNSRKMGITENITSIRCVNIAVLDLSDSEALQKNLLTEIEAAVSKEGAEGIVLGCTGMLGLAKSLEEEIDRRGIEVPVIDPTGAAVGFLQSLHRNGISHSKRTYPAPPEKERNL
jgi:allantoin racemase